MTASFHLPNDDEPVQANEVSQLDVQLRELEFHPERHLDSASLSDSAVRETVTQKQNWIAQSPPRGSRMDRHLGIVQSNERLHPWLNHQRESLQRKREQTAVRAERQKTTHSREYSFCLFPEELIERFDLSVQMNNEAERLEFN